MKTRTKIIATVVAFFLSLAGCTNKALSPEELQARLTQVEADRRFFAGTTKVELSTPRILQIEYHSPDGKAYLWHPGNSGIVLGQWDVRPESIIDEVVQCYRYDNTRSAPHRVPFGEPGDLATCISTARQKRGFWYAGDPYNLESGRIPFVMMRAEGALDQVIERTGINPANLQRKRP